MKYAIHGFVELSQVETEAKALRFAIELNGINYDFDLRLEVPAIGILDAYEVDILDWANENYPNAVFTISNCRRSTGIGNQTIWKRFGALTKRGYFELIQKPTGGVPSSYRLTELGRSPINSTPINQIGDLGLNDPLNNLRREQ